jgi:hypothetical protein
LLLWGAINLGAWLVLGGNYRSTLLSLPNPGIEIFFLAYSGAIIGGLMLLFASLGLVIRHPIIVFLNGLSLLGVGLWNLLGDFFAMAVLKSYGYTIDTGPTTIWMFLGILQIVWGGRDIKRYFSIPNKHSIVETLEMKHTKDMLKNLVKEKPAPDTGLLELTIPGAGWLPYPLDQPVHYIVKLLPERAICIKKNLDDFFVIERGTASKWEWKTNNNIELVDDTNKKRKVVFSDPSSEAFKTWAGVRIAGPYREPVIEPVILSSQCAIEGNMARFKNLLLTNSELVIRTPDAPERDIRIPVSSITKILVTKRIMEKTLSIYTNQTKYKLHYVKKLDEWASKLNQLLKQKDAGQKVG